MNPFTDTPDLKSEVEAILSDLINKWELRTVSPTGSHYALALQNQFCRIELPVEENAFVGFRFQDPRQQTGTVFELSTFLMTVPNNCVETHLPRVEYHLSNADNVRQFLKYYREVIETCLEKPLTGDYTWATAYNSTETSIAFMGTFLRKFPFGDPKPVPILTKRSLGDLTWLQDAKALYQEIHGTVLE